MEKIAKPITILLFFQKNLLKCKIVMHMDFYFWCLKKKSGFFHIGDGWKKP